MPQYFDDGGQRIALGQEIARGGEGAVYHLSNDSNLVAKIYHSAPDQLKAQKLNAMASAHTTELASVAAWPIKTLKDGNGVAGILMPKLVKYQDVHKLFGPKSRMQHFPDLSWQQLIHVAGNIARAFAIVHKAGHVIGDVNHSSVQVAANGTVKLIDCDSFQINHAGKQYSCDVGVLTHQPPEMQNLQTFRGRARTANYDNFGLAVLIFQTLFLARHPFAGRYSGKDEMPIERAIKEYRFAYGPAASSYQMAPPLASLTTTAVTNEVATLFEKAFSKNGEKSGRPTALEWVNALDGMKKAVTRCKANSGHHYVPSAGSCPLCAIERMGGTILFLPAFQAGGVGQHIGGVFNLVQVWARIQAIQPPRPITASFSKPEGIVRPEVRQKIESVNGGAAAQKFIAIAIWVGGLAIAFSGAKIGPLALIVAVVAGFIAWNREGGDGGATKRELKNNVDGARAKYEQLKARLANEASTMQFDSKLNELKQVKQQYEALPGVRLEKLRRLEQDKRKIQLQAFLDKFEIDKARISSVGPSRKATLESHGIETAADLDETKIARISGFGPVRVNALMNWRRECEKKFVFNPAAAIDRSAFAVVEGEILKAKVALEAKLGAGPAELGRLQAGILKRQEAIIPIIEHCLQEVANAEAEWQLA